MIPFIHECEKCGDLARSTFFNDVIPSIKPSQEWYRPSLTEVLKMENSDSLVEHILNGGLISKKIIRYEIY